MQVSTEDDFPGGTVVSFPSGSVLKSLPSNVGEAGLIPGQEDPLEEEMEIHSSILAWKSPWTQEPSRLQSMESQRVGRD